MKNITEKESLGLDRFETGDFKKSVRVARMWPQIEKCLSEGLSHKVILNQLNDAGFDITMHYYKIIIKRIRKKNRLNPDPDTLSESRPARKFSTECVDIKNDPKKFVHDVTRKVNW